MKKIIRLKLFLIFLLLVGTIGSFFIPNSKTTLMPHYEVRVTNLEKKDIKFEETYFKKEEQSYFFTKKPDLERFKQQNNLTEDDLNILEYTENTLRKFFLDQALRFLITSLVLVLISASFNLFEGQKSTKKFIKNLLSNWINLLVIFSFLIFFTNIWALALNLNSNNLFYFDAFYYISLSLILTKIYLEVDKKI